MPSERTWQATLSHDSPRSVWSLIVLGLIASLAAGGFYRRSLDNRMVRAIHPDGFLPLIESTVDDAALTAGFKGAVSDWLWDADGPGLWQGALQASWVCWASRSCAAVASDSLVRRWHRPECRGRRARKL